jgi:hypothetical protein
MTDWGVSEFLSRVLMFSRHFDIDRFSNRTLMVEFIGISTIFHLSGLSGKIGLANKERIVYSESRCVVILL